MYPYDPIRLQCKGSELIKFGATPGILKTGIRILLRFNNLAVLNKNVFFQKFQNLINKPIKKLE